MFHIPLFCDPSNNWQRYCFLGFLMPRLRPCNKIFGLWASFFSLGCKVNFVLKNNERSLVKQLLLLSYRLIRAFSGIIIKPRGA